MNIDKYMVEQKKKTVMEMKKNARAEKKEEKNKLIVITAYELWNLHD